MPVQQDDRISVVTNNLHFKVLDLETTGASIDSGDSWKRKTRIPQVIGPMSNIQAKKTAPRHEKEKAPENKIAGDVKTIKTELMSIIEELDKQKRVDEYNNRMKIVIVFGFIRKNNPDKAAFFTELCNSLELNITKYDIKRIQIINSQSEESSVKTTFISNILRNEILKIKDLPKDVRETRQGLFKHLLHYKSQGSRVLMKYHKLLIDVKLHTLETLEKNKT